MPILKQPPFLRSLSLLKKYNQCVKFLGVAGVMVSRHVTASRRKYAEQVAGSGHGASAGAEAKRLCPRHGAAIGGDKGGTPRSRGRLPVSSVRPERRRVRISTSVVLCRASQSPSVSRAMVPTTTLYPTFLKLSLFHVAALRPPPHPLPILLSPSEKHGSAILSTLSLVRSRLNFPGHPCASFLVLPGTSEK